MQHPVPGGVDHDGAGESSSPTNRTPACSAPCPCGRASTCRATSCRLVVIDRIPFPRPDDPLMTARSRAVAQAGGNGFMTVSATHAAIRLAQGAGRLIRSTTDKGVVAVLDSRLSTERYGGFLRAALPPFWPTTDPSIAWRPWSGSRRTPRQTATSQAGRATVRRKSARRGRSMPAGPCSLSDVPAGAGPRGSAAPRRPCP